MSLPFLNVSKMKVTVPITGTVYTIRPYLAGEEKALLLALESDNPQEMIIQTVKNLLVACVDEISDADIVPIHDVEYLFLQLRRVSVSDEIEFGAGHEEDGCDHIQTVGLNIDDLKTKGNADNKIILDEEKGVGVVMRPPTNNDVPDDTKAAERGFALIRNCIVKIFDDENVWDPKDFTKEQLDEWIDHLNRKQIKAINDYFENLPTYYFDLVYTCEKCKATVTKEIKGLKNFLA